MTRINHRIMRWWALSAVWCIVCCYASAQPATPLPIHKMVTGQTFQNIVKLTNVVVDENRGKLYFAGSLSRHIGVIDTQALQMTDAIDTGVNGFTFKFLRLNPATGMLYMFVLETGQLFRINPLNRTVSNPISVQRAPVIDPTTHRLYITEMPDKIRIYSADMQLLETMSGLTDPGELFVDATNNRLYMLHTYPPPRAGVSVFNLTTKAFIRRYNMPVGFDGLPKGLYVANGKIYVASNSRFNSLSIIDVVSGAGVLHPLSEAGGPMEVYQGNLYQMTGFPFYPGYLPQADGSYGILEVRQAVSGVKTSEIWTDFETTYFDIDSSTGRLFYTATGNGMVGVMDLTNNTRMRELDVTTTIEDVVVHPADGSVYLRNRLGGSTIYRVDPSTRTVLSVLRPGHWPTKLLLDSARNRLYSLSHYEAKVSVFDLTSDERVLEIPLQTQRARTDALSTMAMNGTTGQLYAVMPELGTLTKVSVDGSGTPVTVFIDGFDPTRARGPGSLHLAVSPNHNRVYVFHRDSKRLQFYDGNTLQLQRSVMIPEFNQSVSPLDLLYYDETRGRLFVGPHIVDAVNGAVLGRIAQGLKVIGVSPDGRRYYVLERMTPNFYERVLEYDETLQTVLRHWDFSPIQGVFSAFEVDFARNRLYCGYFERGELDIRRLGCAGDANHDHRVDDQDLLMVLFAFGGGNLDADFNLDGTVDDTDLLEVLFRFGQGC